MVRGRKRFCIVHSWFGSNEAPIMGSCTAVGGFDVIRKSDSTECVAILIECCQPFVFAPLFQRKLIKTSSIDVTLCW